MLHGGGAASLAAMKIRKTLRSDEKLTALRKGDPSHDWQSLDDRLSCIVCDRNFSGRQVDVSVGRTGHVRLRCPSEGCKASPLQWIAAAMPPVTVTASAWQVLLGVLDGSAKQPRATATNRRAAAGAY